MTKHIIKQLFERPYNYVASWCKPKASQADESFR